MQEVLRDAGYQVITASDGVEGLAIFEQQSGDFALVVADLMTPKMTGKELYDRVRSLDNTIRFLFVSGYPSHQINQKLMLDGGFSLLPKPFDLDDLVAKVQEVLEL
jgi:DNA-binding response OmpR family regulator